MAELPIIDTYIINLISTVFIEIQMNLIADITYVNPFLHTQSRSGVKKIIYGHKNIV